MDILNLIPTIPTVRFENYLDQLVGHKDQFTSPIRVRGIERFTDKITEEVGQITIKNELGISTACLRGWTNGRRGMPLSSLKKIVEMRFDPDLRPFV